VFESFEFPNEVINTIFSFLQDNIEIKNYKEFIYENLDPSTYSLCKKCKGACGLTIGYNYTMEGPTRTQKEYCTNCHGLGVHIPRKDDV